MKQTMKKLFSNLVVGKMGDGRSEMGTFPSSICQLPSSKSILSSARGAALALTVALSSAAQAQQSVTTSNGVTQNFDSMGSSSTATMPTGWKTGTDWSTASNVVTQAAGTSGTGVVSSSSSGGVYNFANGVTASSTDRAIGFLTSSGFSSPRSIIYAFQNNTGATITSLTVSWDYEKYRSGSRAFDWTFFHGSTSTADTAASSGNQSYTADANNTTVSNPPASTSKSVTISGLSIAPGATYYLRWTYTGNGGSSNAQGLGIDNFVMTATLGAAATAPGAPSITGITAGDQNLTVNFTAPSSDGGSTISNYKYSTDGTTYVTRSPASTNSPLVITGLSNGTPYSVTLKAVNSIGDSVASTAVSGTPAAPQVVPTVTPATIAGKVGAAISTNITASSAPTSYAIVPPGTLPAGLSLNTTSGAITGSPSNVVSGYTVSVTASNAAGNSTPADLTFNIAKGDQTITGLSTNSSQYSTNAPYALTATADSGLAVSYASSDTNVASISGSMVTIVGVGTTTITASQAGDDNWNAAPDVTQTLTVTVPPPSITLTSTMGGFNAALGTASDSQSFSVVALNLTNDVIITPGTGFEVSADGSSFTNSLTLAKGTGGLTNDISVRLSTNALGGLIGTNISVATATNGTNNLIRTTSVRGAVGVYWDFLSSASPVTNAVPNGWTLGPVAQGNNNGGAVAMLTNSSASSGYGGASGGTNAGVAAQTGALNLSTSAYFEVPILVPDTNTLTEYGIQKITFGTRSTPTGPINYTVRSSKDNYASDLALGTMLANSTWVAVSNNNVGLVLTNGTNTIRIYGYGSANATQSGGTANWRIDDLVLTLGSIINTNPTFTFLPNSVTGLKGFTGTASSSASYVVKGTNLTTDATVQASSSSIQISQDNSTFTNQLTLTQVGGVISNTIYVRLSSSAPLGAVSGVNIQHVSGALTNLVSVSGTVYDAGRGGSATTLAGWDVNDQVGGSGNFGPSPLAPTISNGNVIVGGLTRGSGVATATTGAGRAWGGTTWEDATSADAIANGKYVTFTLQAVAGKTLSVTNISKFNYRSAGTTGPTNGLLQYQVGSGAFQDVGSSFVYTANGNGQTLSPINLSGIAALQNVSADKLITFRIVNWGGQPNSISPSNPGSWYLFDTANTPDVDFEVQGSLADAPTDTPQEQYLASFGLVKGTPNAAGTADPDGDGMNNDAEFAFGTSPVSGASRAATLSSGTGTVKLTWLQRNTGVTYTVKSLPDLTTAFDSGTTVSAAPTNPQPGGVPANYTQYEASVSTGGDRAFLRVKAVAP